MPSNYWLKLYHELLHDPKMAMLDSDTWRRCIEMFLFAGEHGTKRGYLPDVTHMAWTLHTTEDALTADIDALVDLGILSRDDDGDAYVTQFESRQAPASSAARQKRHRERSHKAQHYGHEPRNEHVTTRNTELESDTETETEKIESADVPAAVAAPPAKPKRKRRSTADPRTAHPAIQAYRTAVGGRAYPKRELYDPIIEALGETPDIPRLTDCRRAWIARGFKPVNYAWLFEWYQDGIPMNGKARASPVSSIDAAIAEFEQMHPEEADDG